MTKVLTSCLSHHQASDSVQWPGEHTLSMDHRWQSPRPGRPGRGGPPASLDFSCSLPWPKPPPAPRRWGITIEAVSSGFSQPPAQLLCKDIETFFEEVVQCLWNILSREELLLLLNEFLERIKAEASLSREDVDELHKYLNELKRALVEEDQERLSKEQLDRRRFLNQFPRVKRQLEECISKFRELADKAEKVHKGCTISNVMAHSTGAVSGILTIVGLALALMTMGSSVVLLATVTGLGAVGTVTSVSTSILEHMKRSSVETIASRMMSTLIKKWKVLLEILKSNPTTEKVTKAVQCIEMHIHDMQTGKAISDSAANILMGLMILSSPSIQKKEAGFKAPAFTVTKGGQIVGLATSGVFLLVDVGFLVKDSKHLHDGAKAASAENLWQRARELERKLEELTQIYERLQEDLIQPPPEQCGVQGRG